jgi:hypothetical protein
LSLLLCSCIRNGVELLERVARRTGHFETRHNCREGRSLPLALEARRKVGLRAMGIAAMPHGLLFYSRSCCDAEAGPRHPRFDSAEWRHPINNRLRRRTSGWKLGRSARRQRSKLRITSLSGKRAMRDAINSFFNTPETTIELATT